jgi:pyrimidine operon attenuation protein/uracil phosphoribosyltransferase
MSANTTARRPERVLYGSEEFQRLLWRLSRELQERHPQGTGVTLCGIVTRGVFLADRLRRLIEEQGGGIWTGVRLDVGPFRDDGPRPPLAEAIGGMGPFPLEQATPEAVHGSTVVLVDDVLYHGRTARAALAALAQLGRPNTVELLALVDRGHRELPLRATYVGKNLPTSEEERVFVRVVGCDREDAILLHHQEGLPG